MAFNQKGEEFDGVLLRTRRRSERSQSKKDFCIRGEFGVIVNDVRRSFSRSFWLRRVDSWVAGSELRFRVSKRSHRVFARDRRIRLCLL